MKVYAVKEVVDDEYGCAETQAIFSTREKAQAFVDKNQYQWSAWWFMEGNETRNALTIDEFELDEEPLFIEF